MSTLTARRVLTTRPDPTRPAPFRTIGPTATSQKWQLWHAAPRRLEVPYGIAMSKTLPKPHGVRCHYASTGLRDHAASRYRLV